MNERHGMSHLSEHKAWVNMRQRCSNWAAHNYDSYGGKGVRVCERWQSFRLFLADMGPKPSPSHSLDRVDPFGNYEPGNCRWASPEVQRANTRASRGRGGPRVDARDRLRTAPEENNGK